MCINLGKRGARGAQQLSTFKAAMLCIEYRVDY